MTGKWGFAQDPVLNRDLDLATAPEAVRPETHWLQCVAKDGRKDGRLWVSLQLSLERAKQLRDAFSDPLTAPDLVRDLVQKVLIAPASHAALGFAIKAAEDERKTRPPASQGGSHVPDRGMDDMLGTDILVPPEAFEALSKLVAAGTFEVTDAGIALDRDLAQGELDPKVVAQSIPPGDPIPRGPVIIAIIDDGIGIAHRRFRATANTTRIKHFLDLALIGDRREGNPSPELLGWSWTSDTLDGRLPQSAGEEEAFYRALGLIDPTKTVRQPLRAAVSHGTHMLDIAAGSDSGRDDRPIIAVQLPAQVAENRSDAWLPQSIKRSLDWILVKADQLSAKRGDKQRLPLIVNCSFGSMAGPQDGWSDVERRITQFVRTYRAGGPEQLCSVVMSAGNAQRLRANARIENDRLSSSAKRVSMPWRVLPDDTTPSFVQIWLPESAGKEQQVRVALRPPGQDDPVEFSMLDRALDWTVANNVLARLYHQRWRRPNGKRRESVTIAIRPTADDGERKPVVPAGLWHIDIEPAGQSQWPHHIDLHVHRDDVGLFARGKGRQSYFDDPDYVEFELAGDRPAADGRPPPGRKAMVRAEGTLNAYGYGEGTTLVGGYRLSDGQPARYSSAGADDMKRRKRGAEGRPVEGPEGPDRAAVTEESPALPGVLAAGTVSGSTAILNGTSVAAPLAVRALADEIGDRIPVVLDPTERPSDRDKSPAAKRRRQQRLGSGRLPFAAVPGYRRRTDDRDPH